MVVYGNKGNVEPSRHAWIYNVRGKEIPGSDKVGDKAKMVPVKSHSFSQSLTGAGSVSSSWGITTGFFHGRGN